MKNRMIKSRIIFYGMRSDIEGMPGTLLLKDTGCTPQEINRTIKMFDERKVTTLFVPIFMCHGWRTKLTQRECIVLFTDSFTREQVLQAKGRLAYEPHIDEERHGGEGVARKLFIETSEDSKIT